jgi:hypothetical protein
MNIEEVPLGCRACPNIFPYIRDVLYPEAVQIDDDIRRNLIEQFGYSSGDVDRFAAENQLDLEQSKRALSEAAFRTIGCAGVKIVVVDPAKQSSKGQELICQSVFESDGTE